MGRVWVRLSARLLGWAPGQMLTMTVRDGVVHMSGDAASCATSPALSTPPGQVVLVRDLVEHELARLPSDHRYVKSLHRLAAWAGNRDAESVQAET